MFNLTVHHLTDDQLNAVLDALMDQMTREDLTIGITKDQTK